MSDSPVPLPLLWWDTETTGLGPADAILEVAAVLTTPFPECEKLWEMEWITARADRDILARIMSNDVVREMHEKSGLLKQMRDSGTSVSSFVEIEHTVLAAINDLVGHDQKVQLAGTGVSHYDLPIIKRMLPALANRLYYAPLDVGQLRRWFKAAGWRKEDVEVILDMPHRAMGDVRVAMAEAKHLVYGLQSMLLCSGSCGLPAGAELR